MKWKVLITAEHIKSRLDRFKEIFDNNDIEIHVPSQTKLTEEELLPIIEEYDGAITVADQFNSKVLDKAKKLKVISKWGTGIDTIDKDYAEKLGIQVFYTPGAFTVPVSDTVIGFMLCFARNIINFDKEIREEKWDKYETYSLEELSLGIIGLGRIGLEVAKKANAFSMKIFGNDIKDIPKEILERHNIILAKKDEIFYKCDFITLHTDLNDTSHHMVNEEAFKKMKKNAVLINTSRGAVIKTEDLIKALEQKMIKGVALDVFEAEPLLKSSPLRKFENCILSPHNSNASYKYWEKVHENTINNLIQGLKVGRTTSNIL